MHLLLAILYGVLFAGAIVGMRLQHLLQARLRATHPQALRILDESAAGVMAFQRYLWRRQYVGLGDASFARRADFLRRYWQAFFTFFLLALAILATAIIYEP